MKNFSLSWILALSILAGGNARAEIAILCGDLAAIEKNEKAALVHVDFDSERVMNRSEVKFLYQLGVDKKVKSASTDAEGNILVTTRDSSFLFRNVANCEPEGTVSVVVGGSQQLSCACYSD